MVVTEIVLIVIGIIAFAASFFVTEKMSQKDLDQITLLSEVDLKLIAEKQVKSVMGQVVSSVDEVIEDSMHVAKRGLEKETNRKIMAVSEYSDTVMNEINKTHNEIMFLYSMLSDKQAETANMVSDLQRVAKQIREMDVVNMTVKTENIPPVVEMAKEIEKTEEATVTESEEVDLNKQILQLHKEGKNEVEIAKTLDCGLGVIRLVLGLYHET